MTDPMDEEFEQVETCDCDGSNVKLWKRAVNSEGAMWERA